MMGEGKIPYGVAQEKDELLRELWETIGEDIVNIVPECPARQMAIARLLEAIYWARAAVTENTMKGEES